MSYKIPAHLARNHGYADTRVSFAIDVSGSTKGLTLQSETNFVQRCAVLLNGEAYREVVILPWDDEAHTPRSIDELDTLACGGYTIPGVIIEDAACRRALKASSLWFLLTDGLVDEVHRRDLAKLIPQHSLHGTSCITIIFGDIGLRRPNMCNISVGISVFAVVPNCIFLFQDIITGNIYILQCKGIFNSLLQGQKNPIFQDDTLWSDLPRFSVSQLQELIIPRPKELSSGEIALQDEIVIDFEALFADRLSKEQVTRIFDNDDSIKSIMHTAQTRGLTAKYQKWMQQQETKPEDPLFTERIDIEGSAALFNQIIALLQITEDPSSPRLRELQTDLRKSYSASMELLLHAAHKSKEESQRRSLRIQSYSGSAAIHSASSLSHAPSILSRGLGSISRPTGSAAYDGRPFTERLGDQDKVSRPDQQFWTGTDPANGTSLQALEIHHMPVGSCDTPSIQYDEDLRPASYLYTQGFRRTSATSSFNGNCLICGSTNSTLAWLFRSPPDISTQGFPAIASGSMLNFPLGMGNYPETDVLSSTICCEACATFCVQHHTSPDGDYITGALPIVSYENNRSAWHGVLAQSFNFRFHMKHLPQVFLAVLLTAPEMVSEAHKTQDGTTELFCKAATWTVRNILLESTEIACMSASFSQSARSMFPLDFSAVLSENFEKMSQPRAPLMLYPLEGFAVILNALRVGDPRGRIVSYKDREMAVFRRVLLAMVEQHISKAIGQGHSNDSDFSLISPVSSFASTSDSQDYTMTPTESLPQHNHIPERVAVEDESADSAMEWTPVLTPGSRHDTPFSVSIAYLRDAELLSDAVYGTLRQISEFRQFEQADSHAARCFGPPAALFLHFIRGLEHGCTAGSAPNLFDMLMTRDELVVLSVDPWTVTREIVARKLGGIGH